jgi:RimJ/RimL family protein N-acetyltransferase
MRGHAILRKLGATREACLRESFKNRDVFEDHVLWALIATDWTTRATVAHPVH